MKFNLASKCISEVWRAGAVVLACCLFWSPVSAQDPAADWQQAQAALKRGAYAEAESGFRQFLTHSPSVAEAHVNLGLTLHLQKKYAEAVPVFRRALELQPGLTHAYLFLGIDSFNLNETSEAIKQLRKYTQVAPADAQGHYYLGLSLASRGESEKAVAAFEQAARLAPRDVDILYHLAQSYMACANAIVLRVAERDPKLTILRDWEKNQQSSLNDLVRLGPTTRNIKAELRSLQPRLNKQPIDIEAEQLAAAAYANLYLETTRQFVQVQPDSFRIHQLLAAYYEKTGQTEKAIAELEQIIAKGVRARGVHFALGSIYKDRHEPELALQQFREELKMSSPEPETPVQIALVYLATQRNKEALRELQSAGRHLTGSAAYWQTLGKAYTALEQYPEAAASFEKALALGPADRTLLYQAGQAYRRVGKTELARKLLAASNEAAQAQLAKERARTEQVLEERRKQGSQSK